MPPTPEPTTVRLAVDRVACTAHGICSTLLPDQVRLDEWGYPVLADRDVDPSAARSAVRLCPARALFLRP